MAADQGPTTVGTIVGKLRMDRAQWLADVAATKQEARELGALEPDIHIDDNAATVIARMKAAKAATEDLTGSSEKLATSQARVTAAMKDGDLATARVNVAQMRLNELRDKGITSGSRHAAAELALAVAQARVAEATDDTADATIRANEANRTSVTRVGAIVTAVALLVPLLAPAGAAVVGLGGAFLGMGAAGVLALFGIKREMDAGTQAGSAYRSGIDSLKGSMGALAQTAAVAMLSSFQRVVKETTQSMPMLNTQVGQFSGLLGRSGANLFTGTTNALRILNPLFLTAGVYLESLTEGFQRWTEGSGIEQFSGYALSALPQVVDVLGKLAAMVMHILEALIPLGTVGLVMLGGIADVINAIPVDVLSQLIVTLTWGAVAFKAWGFVAPMLASIATSMGAVGAATTIATGPIGWVVAGLAALAGIFAVVIANNTGATQAMQDYTAAVDADSGAIGENVRVKAAQKLLDSGALDAAKKLKVSLEDVTAATLGDADAKKRVNEQLKLGEVGSKQLQDGLKKLGIDIVEYTLLEKTLTEGIKGNSAAITGEVERYNLLHEALTATTAATDAQHAADEAVAASLGISVGALQAARAGQGDLEASTAKATAEMYIQGDAAGLLKQALDALNGKALSAAEAQNQFESQLVRMPDYIDETTGAYDAAGASLDGMSESAITNRGALLDLIQSAQDSAQAYRDQGASSGEAKQKLIDSKQAIEDQAVANGLNREAVKAYLDELFKIPETVPTTKVEVDTANAEAKIATFKANLQSIFNKTWNLKTTAHTGTPLLPGSALGGTARGMAGGGSVVGPGTAGSDSAGFYRLAHGEEVISNVFGQADRNRPLLKQINAGFTPAQAAAGVSKSAAPAPGSGGTTVQVDVHVTTVQNEDPGVLGNIVGRSVKDALRGAGVKIA